MGGGTSKGKATNYVVSKEEAAKADSESKPASSPAPPSKPEAVAPPTTPSPKAAPSPAPPAGAAPKAKAAAAPPKADGVASASQVVGGNWSRPKGPSPEDELVVEDWKSKGKLHFLEGVWCAVPYKVTVVLGDDMESEAAKTNAQTLIDAVAKEAETVFSHFIDDSEVSAINRLGVGELHKPSQSMKKVLDMASQLNRLTRGAFDPAILPVARYYKQQGAAADEAEGKRLASVSKWSSFQITDEGVKKTQAEAQMDLCGLAKGWAIDEMSAKLKEAGFSATFVDWGGDIKVTGTHPAGRNWTAAVLEPPPEEAAGTEAATSSEEKKYLLHAELRDGQSIATSGDYLQVLAPGMSHVIDPRTGGPVKIHGDSSATVSVVTNSCMLADALATAAMACGTVKAGRALLDMWRGAGMRDPIQDYLLYSRWGPRVCRLVEPGLEKKELKEDRLGRHEEAHIVIVGGGLAGVSAAIEAANARAKVTIIEKEESMGGNSAKATSGINACGTRVQKSQGVEDDGRFFERDTHVSAKGGTSDLNCVTMLSTKSADAIHWLMDEMGVPLQALSQLGGHAKKRTHRVPPRTDGTPVPVGWTIMQHAKAAAMAMPNIEVKTSCTMKRLLHKEDEHGVKECIGVEYEDASGVQQLMCDAVVLTTGGFGFDHSEGSLMSKYRPDLVGVPTTNGSFANGDGIKFGEAIGANLIDMDKVQLHPTAFIDPKDPKAHTKYLGPEALRGSGGILLDQSGRRFVNELDLRSVVSNKILDHCEPYKMPDGTEGRPWAWCLLNEEAQEKFGKPMLSFYKDQVGLFEGAENTKALSELIGCDEANIVESLKEYAAACDTKICSKTGKVVFPTKVTEKDTNLIVARITPCIHYCMGGLVISSGAEVMTESKTHAVGKRQKIRRLFAAGECTGGVHGGNRLGGNSLLECVVFGRLAGERAATIKQKHGGLFDDGQWHPVKLREVRATDEKYGQSTAVYRFELHGALQTTGLQVGRFISIRGELDGDTLTGYYSPISRPDDEGVIDILCRTDEKGGPIVNLLTSLQPGSACMMQGMGGCKITPHISGGWEYAGRKVNKISLLCGGTGLAPAVQIARAYIHMLGDFPDQVPSAKEGGVKIVYAAENSGDLAFVQAFDALSARFPGLVSYYLVLNKPPKGWTQGIGFVDQDVIRQKLWFPPADDHVTVMCGPPIFEKIMSGNLAKMGYPGEQYYSFAADNGQ